MKCLLLITLLSSLFIFIPKPLNAQLQRKIILTWTDTNNPPATTYTVYRSTGLCSGAPVFSKLATGVTIKTYTDDTVTPGNYCYQVTATLNSMESAPSPTVNPAVTPFPPSTVSFQVQ